MVLAEVTSESKVSYLLLLATEVVSGLLLASDSLFQVGISTIISTEDGPLIALWVVNAQTDSTVLASISNLGSWTNGCYVVGEEESKHIL